MKQPLPKCTHPDCDKIANYGRGDDEIVCKDHIDQSTADLFKPLRSLCQVCGEIAPSYGLKNKDVKPTHCLKCAQHHNSELEAQGVDDSSLLLESFRKRKSPEPEELEHHGEYHDEKIFDSDNEYHTIEAPNLRARCPREKHEFDTLALVEARKIVDVLEGLNKHLRNAVKKIIIDENSSRSKSDVVLPV
jgi:hypothetical protein